MSFWELICEWWKRFKKIAIWEIMIILSVSIPLGWHAYSLIGQKFDKAEKEYLKKFKEMNKDFKHLENTVEKGIEKIAVRLDQIERDNRDFHGRLSKQEGKSEYFLGRK